MKTLINGLVFLITLTLLDNISHAKNGEEKEAKEAKKLEEKITEGNKRVGKANERILTLAAPNETKKDKLFFSFRPMINAKATFFGNNHTFVMPKTVDGQPREYIDGFVRSDDGARDGQTAYFGYDNAEQCVGGNTLETHFFAFHSYSSGAGNLSKDVFSPGFEVGYARRIGLGKKLSWGILGAIGYASLQADRHTSSDKVSQITDLYRPATWPPPSAPYAGTFSGSTAFIFDTPTRSTDLVNAASTLSRELDANIITFRAGPYLSYPLGKIADVVLEGGAVVSYVSSDFAYRDSLSIDHSSFLSSGQHSENEFLFGYGVGLNLDIALNSNRTWSVLLGAQFANLGRHQNAINGRMANVDLGQAVFLHIGLDYHF